MPTIRIRHISAEAGETLRRRAAESHQSLQEYLRLDLEAQAARPTLDEVLARAGSRTGGLAPTGEVNAILREDRDRR